jgi:putative MATE family efflux protein
LKIDLPFYKRLALLAAPVIVQNFLQSFVNILDTIMVGRLGSVSIAAAGLGNQVFFLLMSVLFGISSGGSIFFAQYWGKKDFAGIHKTIGISLVIAVFASLVFMIGALVIPKTIIGWFSNDPEVIRAGGVYLRAIALSYPMLAVSFVFSFSLRSTEQARIPMFATACALVINAAFNYLLIFGVTHNGTQIIPALGIQGAGYATVLSRFVESALLVLIIRAKKLAVAAKRIRDYFSFDGYMIPRYAKITAPVIANETLWGLGITMQNSVLAHAGTLALASFNIAGTVGQITWVFFMGLGNATAVTVGKRIGAGDEAGARLTAKRCAVFMPLCACVIGSLLFPLSLALRFLFNVEPVVIAEARRMLLLLLCAYPLRAFNLCALIGIMRAGGDTIYCMVCDVLFLWTVAIPAGAVLAFVVRADPWIIFAGLEIEDVLKTIVCLPRLKSGKWLRNVTV